MKRVLRLASALATVGASTYYAFPTIEDMFLYQGAKCSKSKKHPEYNPKGLQHPGERDLPYEAHTLETDDGVEIHGWLLLQEEPAESQTLVYFHSNVGNRGFRLPHIEEFFNKHGFNVFIFDYRGYGESNGEPSEDGLMSDARAVMDFLSSHPKIDSEKIIVYGRSLGGAVGIYAATHFPSVLGLIIENTFTSVPDLVKEMYHPLGTAVTPFLRNQWGSHQRVAQIQCPILFISGRKDKTIPPEHMDLLFENAVSTPHKELKVVEQGGHNNIRAIIKDEYHDWIKLFLLKSRQLTN